MNHASLIGSGLLALLISTALLAPAADAGPKMKAYEVTYTYDPAFKNGPGMNWKRRTVPAPFEKRTTRIYIPETVKKGDLIRGVMPRTRGFEEFAARNKVAFYDGKGNAPYGGPHKTFLKEAAKVTGHPELAHAGAILHGLSNKGRFAAHFAYFWPERVIAVILDHSWTGHGPTPKPTNYVYSQLPAGLGVPYFFNASKKDMYQGGNRRLFHYHWCTNAFNRSFHPCTSVISYEDVGHGNPGTRELQAVWLEEVMPLRVPEKIPTDGTPYKLIPVNPRRVGGHVYAKAATNEGHTIHTQVDVGPIGFKRREVSWWIPGPKSAAMYLQWVRKNEGKVRTDRADQIRHPSVAKADKPKAAGKRKDKDLGKFTIINGKIVPLGPK